MADTPLIACTLFFSCVTSLWVAYHVVSDRFLFKKYIWKLFRRTKISASEFEAFLYSFAKVLLKFSREKIGALIVIEKYHNLQKYINLGYEVHSKFFADFLYNVFLNKKSAMHDGGVIMRGLEIKSISSYFPITSNKNIPNKLGSRHRAAMGITSKTDAIAFLVSETSGKIMFSQKGQIFELNKDNITLLIKKLNSLLNFHIN
ncbi:diadenylate cyclase CdaM [Candidatus Mycoplasma haematominutum]|uniref:DAC domain-containing protein n=1 Tax=Candidatus Mycoplasma haematominutum 'Birmingham 1' TaxID=1116213 RepID=G8C356_9MOLU|nr:diadenylate cyclase CdaM [Candidatus Mycoplasma haematominutum]CCE66754.1 conserved hypothetical protein (DisA proteindomain) [Candidatus Mycoplasma haematominutum 'Birmingham 1']